MAERGRPPDDKRPAVRLVDAALSAATTARRSALGTSEHEKGRHGPVALVLSGDVGLGAYQADAYAKLNEAGGWRPDWIAGSSTGAVNAALIAGGPPETGVERLRRFWDTVARPEPLALLPFLNEGPWRHALDWMSIM